MANRWEAPLQGTEDSSAGLLPKRAGEEALAGAARPRDQQTRLASVLA